MELRLFNTCSRHTHQWRTGAATSHQVQQQRVCLPGGSTLEDLRGQAHHRVVGFLHISQPHMSCDATVWHDLAERDAGLTSYFHPPLFCFRVFCSCTCLALFCIALLCMILHNIRLFQMGSHVLVLRRLTWVEHGPGAMACALQPVLGRARVRPTCYSGHIAHLNWHCLQPGESSKTYDRIP